MTVAVAQQTTNIGDHELSTARAGAVIDRLNKDNFSQNKSVSAMATDLRTFEDEFSADAQVINQINLKIGRGVEVRNKLSGRTEKVDTLLSLQGEPAEVWIDEKEEDGRTYQELLSKYHIIASGGNDITTVWASYRDENQVNAGQNNRLYKAERHGDTVTLTSYTIGGSRDSTWRLLDNLAGKKVDRSEDIISETLVFSENETPTHQAVFEAYVHSLDYWQKVRGATYIQKMRSESKISDEERQAQAMEKEELYVRLLREQVANDKDLKTAFALVAQAVVSLVEDSFEQYQAQTSSSRAVRLQFPQTGYSFVGVQIVENKDKQSIELGYAEKDEDLGLAEKRVIKNLTYSIEEKNFAEFSDHEGRVDNPAFQGLVYILGEIDRLTGKDSVENAAVLKSSNIPSKKTDFDTDQENTVSFFDAPESVLSIKAVAEVVRNDYQLPDQIVTLFWQNFATASWLDTALGNFDNIADVKDGDLVDLSDDFSPIDKPVSLVSESESDFELTVSLVELFSTEFSGIENLQKVFTILEKLTNEVITSWQIKMPDQAPDSDEIIAVTNLVFLHKIKSISNLDKKGKQLIDLLIFYQLSYLFSMDRTANTFSLEQKRIFQQILSSRILVEFSRRQTMELEQLLTRTLIHEGYSKDENMRLKILLAKIYQILIKNNKDLLGEKKEKKDEAFLSPYDDWMSGLEKGKTVSSLNCYIKPILISGVIFDYHENLFIRMYALFQLSFINRYVKIII